MFTNTITLFNRREGVEGDTWYPSVLRNVQVNMDRAAILEKYGATSSDSAVLHVRYRDENGHKMISGKRWLPPKEWESTGDYANSVTFTTGTRFDFFWVGDWGNEDPVRDTDFFADTDFYTYMNRTHDFVFAVSSVGGPYSVIQHLEIMGK